ncbi:ORF6N domain-containing protein [Candidatus Saganbacteria bacterium]|nr:ORF6N domain-containing protein [Candidatus Saganbacteria bacterium]
MEELIPIEKVENKIYIIRGKKVMLDRDLAELYQAPTLRLNEQVKRNNDRFPEDFMFSLTRQEITNISQIAICSNKKTLQTIKYSKNVNVFTEQGVAMLSGILHSKRAVQVNIAIMRAFIHLRQILASDKDLANKVKELEKGYSKHEIEITTVFKVLKRLMEPPAQPKKRFGFVVDNDN